MSCSATLPRVSFARPASRAWLSALLTLLAISACGKKAAPPAPVPAPEAAPAPSAELPAAATSTVCPGTGNPVGVGKPCAKAEDCKGQLAVDCPRSRDPQGFDFCTRACTGTDPGECGDGAVCVPRGTGPSVCVPASCAPALAQPLPTDVSVDTNCKAGATDLGVGKPCAAHADCNDTKAAKFCPRVVGAVEPAFCSMLCKEDPECGPGAFCWRRKATEHGQERIVSSCAPMACRTGTTAPAAAPPAAPTATP